jgi:hypothetical protein
MSAIRTKEINDKIYSLTLPPPLQAMPICNRAATLIGPLLSKVGGELRLGQGDIKQQAQDLLKPMLNSFGSALQEIDSDRLGVLMFDAAVAAKLHCDKEGVCTQSEIERHFDENRADMYPVLLWCVWECVKDFFPQLEGFAQVAKAAAKESLSPPAGQ